MRADGAIFVDRDQVTMDTLAAVVTDMRGNRTLMVKGDQTVKYGQVREVMDKLQATVPGADTMLLAAHKPKEGEEP